MTGSSVTIKGTKEGLLITFGKAAWETVLADLETHLERTERFFSGGQVVLQVGSHELDEAALQAVVELLEDQEMTLTTVISESAKTRRLARRLGYQTPRPPARAPLRPTLPANGLVLRRTLRSGQSIHHEGSVVIIGDVNPGAQIVAGGDIVVWGHLRGMVHAGALGDNDALVCALFLAPTQLRIGNQIARPPEEDGTRAAQPEIAYIKDGNIIVESWGA